jgi:hypothetical protein
MNSQPFYEIQRLAELLGWRGLRQEGDVSPESGEALVWYWTTDRKFFFQVNPYPQGQTDEYEATVVAQRYGFHPLAVGFHRFSLTTETVADAAKRLSPILSRHHFRNRQWRKAFLATQS